MKYIDPVAYKLSKFHPNLLTVIAFWFAIGGGLSIAFASKLALPSLLAPGHQSYILLSVASLFIFLNGVFDVIDGRVATLTCRASVQGDFLDHVLDRYADIFIIGGIMFSAYCNPYLGALALVSVLLTSYMGTQAQALGCGRLYEGLLARADRLIILMILPLVQNIFCEFYPPVGRVYWLAYFTPFELGMIWFIIAGNFTAIERSIKIWNALKCKK